MATARSKRRGTATLFGVAVVLVAAAFAHARAAGAAGDTAAGFLAAPLDALVRGGLALGDAVSLAMGWLRWPLAAAGLAALAGTWRRGGALRVGAALALAAAAQSALLDGHVAAGLAAYTAAGVAWWGRRAAPLPDPAPAARDVALLAAALALFVAVCLVRLEVYPLLYFDEVAYLRAARMQLGLADPGVIVRGFGDGVYVFEQFRAQLVPLLLQSAGVALLDPDVLPLRLTSLAAGAATLVVAAAALRGRLPARAEVWMVALAATAPLFVAYSRAGFYVAASALHGALCLAAVLALVARWEVRRGLLLGALLGLSLYHYQLAWFAPLLAGLALLAAAPPWRGERRAAVWGAVALAAAGVALPGLWLQRGGLAAVAAQTFDRAPWRGGPAPADVARSGVVALVPDSVSDPELDAAARALESPELRVLVRRGAGDRRVLAVGGERAAVEAARAALAERHFSLLGEPGPRRSPLRRALSMAAQLLYAPDWESQGRYVDGPLLNPLVAPLFVLGLLEALRRARDPSLRALAVWVPAALFLPAIAGGPMPRRASLALPFVYALAALPVVALLAAARRPPWRRLAVAGAAAFYAAVVATDLALYFDRWERRPGATTYDFHLLAFVKEMKGLPVDGPVLVPPDALPGVLDYLEGSGGRLSVVRGARTAAGVREASCARTPPFAWASADGEEARARFGALAADFEIESGTIGLYRWWRVAARRPDGCRPPA